MPKARDLVIAPIVVNPKSVTHLRDIDHARSDLARQYFTDLFEAWHEKGKAVLDTVAMLYPDVFLKVVASHMPREMHATVTKVNVDRVSDAELDAIIARGMARGFSEEKAPEDEEILQ
jgi:hypothetical protein